MLRAFWCPPTRASQPSRWRRGGDPFNLPSSVVIFIGKTLEEASGPSPTSIGEVSSSLPEDSLPTPPLPPYLTPSTSSSFRFGL